MMRLGTGALAVALCCWAGAARAELADEFLARLRDRGWHDTALEYIDQAADDPLATPAFLNKRQYERAITLSTLARQTTREKKRQALLVEAATAFQQFADQQTDSPLQLQALATAGNVYTELALYANNKAEKLPDAARAERKQLNQQARDYLDRAKQPLESLQSLSAERIESLPKAAARQKSSRPGLSRQALEGKQAEAKFLLAKLEFEKARTHEPDSRARKQSLKTATKAFEKIYNEYEDKLVGFYGRFYQGRCLQTSGDIKGALKCYLSIVDQPPIPNPDFRRLVSRTVRHRAECHVAGEDYETAIKECRDWLNESISAEVTQPDWLAVSYQLANIYEAQAAEASGADAKRLRGEARKLYREIARNPGEFQRDAKAKMALSSSGRENTVVVNTFEEAFAAGEDALEQMNSAKLAARLAKENNPDSVESLTQQAAAEQSAALAYFLQATRLADRLTEPDELATARYYLCWLYWETGRYEDAAVIGEFVSRRYSDSKHAAGAANLALASYERLYNAAKAAKEPFDFEAESLASVARLLVLRWPETPEATAALNLLINVALRDNKLPEAEQLLGQLPPSRRAGAELRLGGAFWSRYLRASGKNAAESADEAQTLKAKAGELLARGYQTLESKANVTSAEATGVLYYVQFLLADGRANDAVEAIENASVGPLALIENQSSAASRPEFKQEAYKVGLRAYVSAEPPQREQAQAMMTALESAIGEGDDAGQKVINLYVSLGLQLQQQIRSLSDAGQADKARSVATSFEDLLARVTERAGAADNWKVQSWIAQTNLQLGQGLSGEDAQAYYGKAEHAYRALLDRAAQEPKFAPSPVSVLATKKKLADCLLAQEKFSDAFKQYALILKGKPNMLELQQSAAAALQQWGEQEQDAKRLEEAIRGAMPQANKKNLVWGWLRLAAIADQAKRKAEKQADGQPDASGRVARYQDLFFKARFHVAQSRFAAAKLANGATRQKQLSKARQSLASMQRLYPDLGGPKWQAAYEKLIQQLEATK